MHPDTPVHESRRMFPLSVVYAQANGRDTAQYNLRVVFCLCWNLNARCFPEMTIALCRCLPCFSNTGNPAEVLRLMNLVPKMKDVKVPLGAWRPKGADHDISRMPRGDVLLKASLWMASQYSNVRNNLATPPLQLEVSESADIVKLDAPGGSSSVMVIRGNAPLPADVGSLPFGAVVIDARTMTSEEGDIFSHLPGRSKFKDIPVVVFGGAAEVEEARRGIQRACASQWVGETRVVDVLTSESHSHYSYQRRRVLCMIPTGITVMKMPPVINISNSPTLTTGWLCVIGVLRFLWHRVDPTSSQPSSDVDWLYVLTDDLTLVGQVTQRLESSPSVVVCRIHEEGPVADAGALVAEHTKTAQDMLPLAWTDIIHRWTNVLPLFPPTHAEEPDNTPSSSESVDTPEPKPTPAKRAAPAKQAAKRRGSAAAAPRRKDSPVAPKSKDRAPAAVPRPAAEQRPAPATASSTTRQPTTSRASEEKQRLSERETERQHEREREQERQRERDLNREAERERERQREKERARQAAEDRERDRRRDRERREEEDRERRRRDDSREGDRDRTQRERDRHSVVRRGSSDSRAEGATSSGASRAGGELHRRLGASTYRRR